MTTTTKHAHTSDARAVRWAVDAMLVMQDARRALVRVADGHAPRLRDVQEAARILDELDRLGGHKP